MTSKPLALSSYFPASWYPATQVEIYFLPWPQQLATHCYHRNVMITVPHGASCALLEGSVSFSPEHGNPSIIDSLPTDDPPLDNAVVLL